MKTKRTVILALAAILLLALIAAGCNGTPRVDNSTASTSATSPAAEAATSPAAEAATSPAAEAAEGAEGATGETDKAMVAEATDTAAAGGAAVVVTATASIISLTGDAAAGGGQPWRALPRDRYLTPTTQAAAVSGYEYLSGTQLNLYTWEGMFPRDILDQFERDYGIRVNYINFDFDETMLSKLEAAQGGDYDLVIADDYIIETVIQEGLAQKLDASKLTNIGNIDPMYQSQFYDPTNAYTVPYGAGVQTIVYDPAAVDIEISGYADLWNPALADSVGVIANYRVIDGMALKVLGKSYNTNDLGEIRAAGDKLVELAPNIRLIKDDQLQDDLLSGEISTAVMYTSQVFQAVMENPGLRVVFPKEGIGFGVMAGFVPVNAPNPDAAHLFLNYILNEQIAAGCFVELGYYSTNKAADKYFTADVSDLLILPEGFNVNMEMIGNIDDDAAAEHELAWTRFKSATGR